MTLIWESAQDLGAYYFPRTESALRRESVLAASDGARLTGCRA